MSEWHRYPGGLYKTKEDLYQELEERRRKILALGEPKVLEKRKKAGQLNARERLEYLFDGGEYVTLPSCVASIARSTSLPMSSRTCPSLMSSRRNAATLRAYIWLACTGRLAGRCIAPTMVTPWATMSLPGSRRSSSSGMSTPFTARAAKRFRAVCNPVIICSNSFFSSKGGSIRKQKRSTFKKYK